MTISTITIEDASHREDDAGDDEDAQCEGGNGAMVIFKRCHLSKSQ